MVYHLKAKKRSECNLPQMTAAIGIIVLAGIEHTVGGDGHIVSLPAGKVPIYHLLAGRASASAQVRIRPRSEEPPQRLFLPFAADSSH
jgi:hypothetical protein